MFSSHSRLQKRTPKGGIGREQYLGLLAEEFYTSTSAEAREQVTANLANFAYDPINFDFLKKHKVLDIFLELLTTGNQKLTLHGIVGLCNFCLDPECGQYILESNSAELISNLLYNSDVEIVLNAIATLIYLIRPESKDQIICQDNIAIIKELTKSENIRIKNLATLFLTDYCHQNNTGK